MVIITTSSKTARIRDSRGERRGRPDKKKFDDEVQIKESAIVRGGGQVAVKGGVGSVEVKSEPLPSSVVPVSAGVSLVGQGVDPSKVSYDPQRVVLAEARGDPVSRRVAFASAPQRESVDRNILNQQRLNQQQNEQKQSQLGKDIPSGSRSGVDSRSNQFSDASNNLLRTDDNSSSGRLSQTKKQSLFEKQISLSEDWERGIAKRSEQQDTFFYNLVRKSPFRKDPSQGLTFAEEVGVRGLQAPGKILTGFESIGSNLFKGGIFLQGVIRPESRQAATTELKASFGRVLPALGASFNLKKPEGIVNVGSAVATPSFISKGITTAKGSVVPIGSKYIAPEEVFAESVLTGKENLPTTKSVSESVSRFEAAKAPDGDGILVQTSGDAPIKAGQAGFGKKATQGLEDPGIYVTPAGEGSPYFLRTGGVVEPSYEFSLNPFKGVLNQPTVTQFKATGVVQLPRDVIKQPGFSAVAEFQKTDLAGTGVVQITKRSEIGLGEIKGKSFVNPVTGKVTREAGTSEIEAVVPVTQTFRYTPKTFFGRLKGYEQYTKFDGELVPIREAELVVTEGRTPVRQVGSRIVSGRRLLAESRSLSELSSVRRVSPIIYSRVSYKSSPSRASSVISTPSSSVTSSPQRSSVISAPARSSYVSQPSRSSPVSSSSSGRSVLRGGSSVGGSSSRGSSLISSKGGGGSSGFVGRSDRSSVISRDFGRSRKDGGLKYDVELRRYGSFKTVGSGLSLSEAKAAGVGAARGTLGATFRVRRSGGGQTVRLAAPSGFYTKGDAIIQRRGFRLSSSGEVREIGIAKNKKKRSVVGGF